MTGPKLHYASQFIIAAMDEWGGPVTPTTGTPVYLKQDYDALQAKVRELEEQIRVATAINHAFKQSEETLEATLHTQQDRVHELEDKLRQVEQERDQLRARVGRLESALRHIAEARWSPRTTASYDEDARYAYPERESYVRQYAQRALEGKEEYGRHDE